MRAQIFSYEKHIGTTELRLGDESMSCIYGDFIPNENYYKSIQKAVWDFGSKSKPDYQKWTAMRFNAQLDNGYFIYAAGGFAIDDIQELQQEPKRIDIAGVDRHVIEDFFLQTEPRPFTEDPWEDISIEQKIEFENELRKEIGTYIDKSFGDIITSNKNQHILADFEISALCHDSRNDDVLFVTRKQNYNKQFAVVHLTWRGAKEIATYPRVEFYDSFDDFKYNRMYPDKIEWEY
ncbi:hypothetical protein [Mucilaginibacter paludis]|uniref:Uncharacterized protein n=1 Tax=Mucilaginibacter paludis DSM 18603 TaxID=714943 RepID=H1YD63_9SPHI|nr:hypothetical protein [Mucilaginibacter paludis]EHQ26120.1 hypothetical protein Mucpa_1977 [Mucilaginibacter paludis DSM 18603]